MRDMNVLKVEVTRDAECYAASFREKDEYTLPEILAAFNRALQIAGFTYVCEITAVCTEGRIHSSSDAI